MKPQSNTIKWAGIAFLFTVLMSFVFLLPSVSAQGEVPSTPTPSETPSETPPLPAVTPEPLEIPELEQEFGVQRLMSLPSNAELGGDWAAQVNVSDTSEESFKPKIATDANGILHLVWRETVNGNQEIFYAQMRGLIQSVPVNVSNSPLFDSDSPQLVVDSAGIAHIVWQEEDDDHGDDFETHYSNCHTEGDDEIGYHGVCTIPAILSNGQVCSSFQGEWKAVDPTIGIDANDNLMVVWMSFEPNPKIYIMYSLWNTSGQPPTNRTGCHVSSGLYAYPTVVGDTSGNFHLVMMSYSYGIFYSKYTNGNWSINQNIGTGLIPVIDIDETDIIHTAWWNFSVPPVYRSKEISGTTWSTNENVFDSTTCSDLSLTTDRYDQPKLVCATNGAVHEASRLPSGWVESTIIESMAGQPDLVKDVNSDLHLVWSDSRTGTWETFYSPTYSCDNIAPGSNAGKNVLALLSNPEVATPFLNYCKNQVDEVIYVPEKNGVEAFAEWANLAKSAKHEVAFTVMFWDRNTGLPDPGAIVLKGIDLLYEEVNDSANANKYPHGMRVRILLGVQLNTVNLDPIQPLTDQRFAVLEAMQDLDIPILKTLPNGSDWKVEVGLYSWGLGSANPPGVQSHVKLMVVDDDKMIVSGYHPQHGFQTVNGTAKNHDLGIKISGPIAANGMAVFDSLWVGSYILCTEADASAFDSMNLGFCHDGIAENPTHWFFLPAGDDIVLPLYRDDTEKTADQAVKIAIESAEHDVYVLQNRVGVPGDESVSLYREGDTWLAYADALLKEALQGTDVRILLSKEGPNFRKYNSPSMKNFIDRYKEMNGHLEEKYIVRFYHPDELTALPGLHAKSFMVDHDFLVIGSQNFDHSAFGDYNGDLDLVEYSVGIENTDITGSVGDYLDEVWIESGKPHIITQNESLAAGIQQADPKDVVFIESGIYEISSTLDIPNGLTIVGSNVILRPSATFSNQTGAFKLAMPFLDANPLPLIRILDDNVTLMGLTFQDSPGYAIEIGDGSTTLESINLSNIVFENNALGGVYIQGDVNYAIESNTFVGGDSGVVIGSNSTGIIRNNVFAGQNNAPVQITADDDGDVEYSYNLFSDCLDNNCAANWHFGDLSSTSNAHDNLFDLDPIFVNQENGDYQLSPGSPAIDAGDPSILNEMNYDGNGDDQALIDIGAFEFLDTASPVVQSITRASANPSNATSVDFTVRFSEPVTGVDISDFTLTTSGVSDALINEVSGEDSVYTVEVNTGTSDGTIRLDISESTSISDLAGHLLIDLPFISGETYTVTHLPIPEFEADEFDGPELAPGWEWYVPKDGPTYSLSVTPGLLRMSLPAEEYFEHWEQDDYAPQLRRADMGDQDWVIETRLENINAAQDVAGYWAALEVGFGQYDQIWYGLVDDGHLHEIRVGNCCTSSQFNDELPVALRLEKHREDYTFLYKYDGDPNWTELSTEHYSGTPTYVGLIGRSWGTGSSDLEIDWSYFRMERMDTPVVEPEDVVVTVVDTDGIPQQGLNTYVFDNATYKGFHGLTDENGQIIFTLPEGSYRFRADLNGTQFWSDDRNHCDVPDCNGTSIMVTKPLNVTVLDTENAPQVGLKVYAFNGTTYTGYYKVTDATGQTVFTLPEGSYRFRADLNGTQFWSDTANHCDIPSCDDINITVTKPVAVTVFDTDDEPQSGLKVYAFNGTTYTGYSATTNSNGQVTFTLPAGSYRFRADLNGTQFWSNISNHCDIPSCEDATITVTKPVIVTVLNTDEVAQEGLKVYAFNGTTYTGHSATTNSSGQVSFTLPLGSYRFRADLNGTQFWSGTANHCDITSCEGTSVTVTNGVLVTVEDTDGTPKAGLKVYAFNGTTYTGYNATTNTNGHVTFTLPQGNYRFRADLNGTQFWSGASNHCEIPICGNANITVSKPISVIVTNTDNAPQSGLKVYVFNGTTYTGFNATTNSSGQVTFTLPLGSYRFRADLNGTQFWSGASNYCTLPECESASIIVTIPVTVTVQNANGIPKSVVKVYAFNGTTYTGYNQTTNSSGQVVFTLPLGNYRFRADYNGVQFWSGASNHCTLPSCLTTLVTVTP